MCFPAPVAQTNPSNPADYAVEDNYKQVKVSSTAADTGKTGSLSTQQESTTDMTRPAADPKTRAGINLQL